MNHKAVILFFLFAPLLSAAQNVGIGTNTPAARLHVNGDLRLQDGDPVSKFSRDSLFSENSHNNIPTEKAIRDYLQRGIWVSGSTEAIGPQAPLARGTAAVNASGATSVHVQGNYAYVTSAFNNISVYNISNPDSIKLLQSINTNLDVPVDVFVQGNYAYVVCENNDRLCIFDITSPGNFIPRGFTTANIRVPTAIFVQGNYAYVTSNMSNNLAVFDISNPDAIVAKGSILTNLSLPTDVFVQGNYAYVTSAGNNRICIYDISNPDIIAPKGFSNSLLSDPNSVSVKGNYAYVASRGNNRLCVFNISNPDAIAANGSSNVNISNPNSISISGDVAFITNISDNSLCLFDISNPPSLVPKGYSTANLDFPSKIFASGDLAYVTSYNNSKLCIFDLDKNRTFVASPTGIQTAATQWQVNGTDIYRSNGNVGIGLSDPLQKLQVSGHTIIDGNIGIGTTETVVPVNLASTLGNKLLLYGDGYTSHYGMGIQGSLLQMYTDAAAANIAFGYGNSNSFTERARFYNTGANGMQVNGRIVLRNGTADINNGPGVWLNNPTNSALMGFIGTQNSSNIGFYGGPGNWGLVYNTSNSCVGIGNQSPIRPLSFPAALGEKILLYPGATGEVGIGVYGNELRIHSDYAAAKISFGYQDNAGNFTERMWLNNTTGVLTVNGTAYPSDTRFKKQISNIQHPLQKILSLNGVEYFMRSEEFPHMHFTNDKQVGLLAQEVERVLPEAVQVINADGYKGVDYAKLVPLLIEGIKEQQRQINELKNLVEQLTKK